MEAMRERDNVDGRFDKVDALFDKIEAPVDKLWRLMLATYVTTLVGLFTAHF